MIAPLFPELNTFQITTLLHQLEKAARQTLPIAFFSHLRGVLDDDYLWKFIKSVGHKEVLMNIHRGREPQTSLQISLDLLTEKGKALFASGQLINHL